MIADALAAVRSRIDAAAESSGRGSKDVTLVAVTKLVDAARVREAVEVGVTDVGENRVQELVEKQDELGSLPVRWHMIGSLQRNKVQDVVGRVTLIHSVDSRRLADAIGARAVQAGLRQDVLLEVNAGNEPTKHGVVAGEALDVARGLLDIEGLRLCGFMTIAPHGDAERARDAFRALRELRDRAVGHTPDAVELSMGMSDDFEVAVEEGSTIVRVGTAIFGARPGTEGAEVGKASGYGR